ncbi:MAG: aspartate aminotransferase family protein [Dehalococcoidales bacterium]|nr:aspartate aminotransferase family protein [Dehalococcoidales bacterium]
MVATNKNNYEEMRAKVFKHIFLPYRSLDWYQKPGNIKILVKGEGIRVRDIRGKEYIDGAAGWQFGIVGHGRVEIAEAILKQTAEITIVAPEFCNIPCIELAEKLAEITPGDLTKVAFCNSGSEAVEAAMKMAKQYHVLNGEPRRHKMISRRGSYHGTTWACMSVMGCYREVLSYFEPMMPQAIRVPQPYCYHCDYGMSYPDCNIQCAQEIERVILNEGPQTVSAVIGDTVSHSSGVAVPPPEYWPIVRNICNKYGVLLINDEVICGFGRTGKWFACEHWDYLPDIINFAKGITSGYIPCAAAITTPAIAEVIESGPRMGLVNFSTWGGNPNSAAGALANISIIERERLVDNSAKMGDYLLEGLKERLYRYPIVGDIRGIGLMVGIELVADKKTRAFFPPEVNIFDRAYSKMEKHGILARDFESTIVLTPPLCLNKSDVEEIIAKLDIICGELAKDLGYI